MIDKYFIPGLIGASLLAMFGAMGYAVYFYRHCPNRVVTTSFGLACVKR